MWWPTLLLVIPLIMMIPKSKKDGVVIFNENDSIILYSNQSLHSIAIELQEYLFRSSGKKIPLSLLRIKNKKTISLLELPDTYDLNDDGFIVSSPTTSEVQVAGKNDLAISYGVYDLLEKNLGIKWLFPHEKGIGVHVPEVMSLAFKREERQDEPAFIDRAFSSGAISGYASYRSWIKKMRMVGADLAFHHNLYTLFPPSQYRRSHSQFYPDDKAGIKYPLISVIGTSDQLEFHSWQPVLESDEIKQEGISNIVKYFNRNPHIMSYSLGVNDSLNWGFEQMKNKKKNSFGFTDMSDYYYSWVNVTVNGVLEHFPRKKFGLLAYHNLIDAPSFKLNPSVTPYMTYDSMQWLDENRKIASQHRIKKWATKANQLGIYDYIYGDSILPVGYQVPRVYWETMSQYYQFAYENKVKNYYAEAYPSAHWIEGPKLYITSKLLWNPYIDVNNELNEWYIASVGAKAAPFLAKYYLFWERFWRDRVIQSRWFTDSKGDYLPFNRSDYMDLLTINDLQLLEDLMNNVKENATTGLYKDRALFFYEGWNEIKSNVFGDVFKFRQGKTPKGYQRIFSDEFDKKEGLPAGWFSWDRPDTGVKIHEKHLSQKDVYKGQSSFKMSITPNGKDDGLITIYKKIKNNSSGQYCFRVQAKSNFSSTIAFRYFTQEGQPANSVNVQTFTNKWRTYAACIESTAAKAQHSLYLFLSVKGKMNKRYEALFDSVEVFKKPVPDIAVTPPQ